MSKVERLQEEVIELEDVKTGVSITDLGLNDFRMDLLNYTKEHGDLAGQPKGLHAIVPSNPAKGLRSGVIFALRNIHPDVNVNQQNRLHPYYLVYLDNDANVIADAGDALAPGTEIAAGGRRIGEIKSVAGQQALALLRIDRAAKAMAGREAITADGVTLSLSVPDWAGFDLAPLQEDAD